MELNLFKENLFIKAFSLTKIPLIFACNPKLIELTPTRVRLRLPLNWFTRNHHGSMYFGALCIGADVAGGLIAMKLIKESGQKISLIFKDFQAEFLRRPDHDVEFICEDGALIQQLVEQTLNSEERQNMPIKIKAIVPKESNDAVALFTLTLSLKRR